MRVIRCFIHHPMDHTSRFYGKTCLLTLTLGSWKRLKSSYNSFPIKSCESAHLTCLFKELFEKMINFSIMPYLFNLSIFKPLVKDPKKSTNDISNLRPIAVSDVYANIFEKILLDEINKCHTDNNKQFGFKKSSSCSHAIFIQLMLYKF